MRHASSLCFAALLCAPISAHASLSCASPCTVGTLSQSGNYYDVFVDCSSGAYSAATGVNHPATIASAGLSQNVIYGGSSGSAGTSSLGVYLHGTGQHFSSGTETGAVTVSPLGTCQYDPTDTPEEVASLGLESEWLLTDANGNTFIWRHEVVTFGDADINAGARLTQSLTSQVPSGPTEFGVRWQVDYQSGFDDGPTLATVVCDPFVVSSAFTVETELDPAQLADFYRMINNDGFSVPVENYASTTILGGFPGTGTPDRLVYGYWGSLNDASWNYVTTPQSADSDSAVLYYFGATQPNALSVPAGATRSRSVVLFSGIDEDDCGDFEPKDTGEPPDTDPPIDTDPPPDTDPPVEPLGSHYAGGCASCNTAGGPGSMGLILLGLALPLVRRRGGKA